jgi:hypothetical protein
MRNKKDTHTLDLFQEAPKPKNRNYVRKTEPRAMVRRTDPDTSRAAANSIDATALEQRVYEVICSFPNGCISDDIVRLIPEHGVQTVSPRYAKLIQKGFIVDTGERRQGAAGRGQRVMRKAD